MRMHEVEEEAHVEIRRILFFFAKRIDQKIVLNILFMRVRELALIVCTLGNSDTSELLESSLSLELMEFSDICY